jgi:cell division protein FtsZ
MTGVEFISINTDAQALRRNKASVQLQIGNSATKGLGAGGKWEVGREAALEDRERIAELIDGADMLFIAAGMGGGTGTGAAPVVAEVAKDLGILAVAVVTKPFSFEGKRMRSAETGLKSLSEHVDSLIVIPNEKLIAVMGGNAKLTDAFIAANDVLHNAVSGISEIISKPGMINVDFADVKTVMSEIGMAMMGSADASGEDRARLAAEAAVASPLLENIDLKGARGVLVNITASRSLKLSETREVMAAIRGYAADDATVIFGTVYDDSLGDALRVTVVATGLNHPQAMQKSQPEVIWRKATGTHDAMPTMADLGSFAPSSPSAAMSMAGMDSSISAVGSGAGMASSGGNAFGVASAQPAAVEYSKYDLPRVFRPRSEPSSAPTLGADSSPQAKTMLDKGADFYEIPAFLRKQAD